MGKTKKDLNVVLKTLREGVEGEEGVLFAYLFGSRAQNAFTVQSDIDVAVFLIPSETRGYLEKEKKILSSLMSLLGTDRIDLRVLNVLPLVLQHRILKEGIVIFIKDEQARVDFETQVMIRYFEMKPYLEEYKEMLFKRIRAGNPS